MLKPETLLAIQTAIAERGLKAPKKEIIIPAGDVEKARLVEGFIEIHKFYEEHDRVPEKTVERGIERTLYNKLKGIAKNDHSIEALKEYDEHGILEQFKGTLPIKAVEKAVIPEAVKGFAGSLAFQKILQNKGGTTSSMFGGQFAQKKTKEHNMPDYVARRTTCHDYDKNFLNLFIKARNELKLGVRNKLKFKKEQHIEAGKFYVLNGIFCYVANKGEPFEKGKYTNFRLRVIFVNGQESDMLLRSFATELYKNGYMITELEGEVMPGMKITEEDVITGWIYVLGSLSQQPEIKALENLHKIGFSTKPVEQRISNAVNETTYLRAPVKLVMSYKCANLDTQVLEQILHTVFGSVRLNLTVPDKTGKVHKATEWFQVPLSVIQEAIGYIMSGTLLEFRYNKEHEALEPV